MEHLHLLPGGRVMLTRREILTFWFSKWATLSAWQRDLTPVAVEVSDRFNDSRLGTCWPMQQRITVYRAVQAPKVALASELDTILHEMAHAATIDEHHSAKWQAVYSRAVTEVTRIPIPVMANNYHILCQAGKQAVASWWRSSGNEALVKMVGVK